MSKKTKDILERALITFLETAFAYIITALAGVDYGDGSTLKTMIIGICITALATGLSAAYNTVLKPFIQNKIDKGDD